ncbi:MAG: heparinase II/III family protein [Alkalilacustris sp.]
MIFSPGETPALASRADLRAARRALRAMSRLAADGAPLAPPGVEGRSLGTPARGRALMQGRLMISGVALPAGGDDPWRDPAPAAAAALHGFVWLDDLMAAGGAAAREVAQRWLAGWLADHATPRGAQTPAWCPTIAARRLIRWCHHIRALTTGPGQRNAGPLAGSLRAHGDFLAARWLAAPEGAERVETATALVYAACIPGSGRDLIHTAAAALDRASAEAIDSTGGLSSRNPEALLAVFVHLGWAEAALQSAGLGAPETMNSLQAARDHIAPALRALRHADGGLARFHGGGSGAEGALDLALADRGRRERPRLGGAMGFARLAARRTTVIVDAAPPPPGPDGQASTLAFELTSGRRPVIAGPGPGAVLGPQWARAVRATAAHATLALEGWSSSRLPSSLMRGTDAGGPLADGPAQVTLTREGAGSAAALVMSHDGWARSHGLVHVRRLALSGDGRTLWGEDALMALTPAQRRLQATTATDGTPFALRFPLHPDVTPTLDAAGRLVRLGLRSGEVWELRADTLVPVLEPSAYVDRDHEGPRASWTVVLAGRTVGPAQQFGWTLAKAEDTPIGVRDPGAEAEEAAPD